MKKIVLFIISVFAFGPVSAQWIYPTKHKTLVLKFTADWCGPCGGWGWSMMEDLVKAHTSGTMNAVPIAFHQSSTTTTSLNVPTVFGNNIEGNLDAPASGIPTFSVGNINLMQATTSAEVEAEVTKQTTTIAEAVAAYMPSWKGDSLIITTKTKFNKASTGSYFVNIYIYENGITAYQTGQGPSATHNNVMRVATGQTAFGMQITGTSFTAGQIVDQTFRFLGSATWNKPNVKLVSVIWKKNGSKYDIVNVNDIASHPTGINNIHENYLQANVQPNPALDIFVVSLGENTGNTQIRLFDITGKKVADIFSGNITSNKNLSFNRPTNLPNGSYYLNIVSEQGNRTLRLLFQ